MHQAMDEVEMPSPSRENMDSFFSQTADFMRNTEG